MKVVVIGAGRMGTWLAESLGGSHEVAVYDRIREKPGSLVKAKPISDLKAVEKIDPDLLINAASLPETRSAFEEVLPYLGEGCLLSDIASVKQGLCEWYQNNGRRFVSTHPMFGPTYSRMENLRGESAILIRESDSEGKDFFHALYRGLGVQVFEYTFEEHDQAIGLSLCVPFACTLAFAACIRGGAVPGGTFKRQLDVARNLLSENHDMLREILFSPHTAKQIERISGKLAYLGHIVRSRDVEEMERFLSRLKRNAEEAIRLD
ncbi:MAG: prephenate dehydrogenase/arogenate dehydrogenase family protein [Thermodesulfobacteriota bacterium]